MSPLPTPVARRAFEAGSGELAIMLGQPARDMRLGDVADVDGDVFWLYSRSRDGTIYAMHYTPEGIAVHQGLGCEGEGFNGPTGCWHSKDWSSPTMTALVPYETGAMERIEFNPEQIKTLKNTICRGASDAELQLFVYACQDTGLNPFLKQIWAIPRNVKIDDGGGKNRYEKQLTIQVGIDGYRVIRDRLRDREGVALFEGMDGPQWSDDGERWADVPAANNPKFARVAIWRRGIPRPFIGTARWTAYVQDSPMWQKMGAEQLAKCAEALALRRAFPAEMGRLPTGPVAEYPADALDPVPSAWQSPALDAPADGVIDGTATVVESPYEHGDTQEGTEAEQPPAPPPDSTGPADKETWRQVQALMAAAPPEIRSKAVRDVPGVQQPARMTVAQAIDAISWFEGEGVKTAQGALA